MSVRGNLSLAHLLGSVPVTDIATGASRTVPIDLTFTGVGPIDRVHSVEKIVDEDLPDVIQLIALHVKARSASVTGEPVLPWDDGSVNVFTKFSLQRS